MLIPRWGAVPDAAAGRIGGSDEGIGTMKKPVKHQGAQDDSPPGTSLPPDFAPRMRALVRKVRARLSAERDAGKHSPGDGPRRS